MLSVFSALFSTVPPGLCSALDGGLGAERTPPSTLLPPVYVWSALKQKSVPAPAFTSFTVPDMTGPLSVSDPDATVTQNSLPAVALVTVEIVFANATGTVTRCPAGSMESPASATMLDANATVEKSTSSTQVNAVRWYSLAVPGYSLAVPGLAEIAANSSCPAKSTTIELSGTVFPQVAVTSSPNAPLSPAR